MQTIIHALSPFVTCPFDCPFCCAKDNETNQYTELTKDYWINMEKSIADGSYQNIMLSGDTEPTLFPEWLKGMVNISNKYSIITELRTHNYKYSPKDTHFNQVWYSITDVQTLRRLSELWLHGIKFADEVNFAILINKDFSAQDIISIRQLLPESKITIRYLLDVCGSDDIAQWVKLNRYMFDEQTEILLEEYGIRIKKEYSEEYDILRQDGKIYHEWQ